MGYRAHIDLRDVEIDGNDMRVRVSREFAKLTEADAWLTGARDVFNALSGRARVRRWAIYDSDGHEVAFRERGRRVSNTRT